MKRSKLFELFRESKEPSFMKFLDGLEKDGVIYAEEVFAEKKRMDKWWKEALDRNNNIREPKDENSTDSF